MDSFAHFHLGWNQIFTSNYGAQSREERKELY